MTTPTTDTGCALQLLALAAVLLVIGTCAS
jgi:hypothetical protein